MGNKKSSLAEIMGKAGAEYSSAGLRLEHLPEVLGEAMPDMPKNAIGRHRLLRSLKQRFGPNFRSLPGISDVVKEFDSVVQTEITISKLRNIKLKRS